MNLFAKHFIRRHQTKLLLFVLWLHVSILDFLNITARGANFFTKESIQLDTLFIHAGIALSSLIFYGILTKIFKKNDPVEVTNTIVDTEVSVKE